MAKKLISPKQIYRCKFLDNNDTLYLRVISVNDRVHCVWIYADGERKQMPPFDFSIEHFEKYMETGQIKLEKAA